MPAGKMHANEVDIDASLVPPTTRIQTPYSPAYSDTLSMKSSPSTSMAHDEGREVTLRRWGRLVEGASSAADRRVRGLIRNPVDRFSLDVRSRYRGGIPAFAGMTVMPGGRVGLARAGCTPRE